MREYDEEAVPGQYVAINARLVMTELERQVQRALALRVKSMHAEGVIAEVLAKRSASACEDAEVCNVVDELLPKGHGAFERWLGERIAAEYRLTVNRCPKCNRIVRTPQARQCLWCGHDWH